LLFATEVGLREFLVGDSGERNVTGILQRGLIQIVIAEDIRTRIQALRTFSLAHEVSFF